MFSNDFATLTEYKVSFRKRIVDYVIRFHSEQTDIHLVIKRTFNIFKQLVEKYEHEDKTIKGRIVALVNYFHTVNETNVSYYHPSFHSEIIDDVDNFFCTHMLKIAERMENMNRHGSNLLIKNIQEIHLHITVQN